MFLTPELIIAIIVLEIITEFSLEVSITTQSSVFILTSFKTSSISLDFLGCSIFVFFLAEVSIFSIIVGKLESKDLT